jgi:hypothetical protein
MPVTLTELRIFNLCGPPGEACPSSVILDLGARRMLVSDGAPCTAPYVDALAPAG